MLLTRTQTPTLIAEGTSSQGTLSFHSETHIFGVVEGEALQNAKDLIWLGITGWVQGSIKSEGPVIIEGKVDGDVYSSAKVTVKSTGQVNGNIFSKSIEIHAGAAIEGEIQSGKPAFTLSPHLAAAA